MRQHLPYLLLSSILVGCQTPGTTSQLVQSIEETHNIFDAPHASSQETYEALRPKLEAIAQREIHSIGINQPRNEKIALVKLTIEYVRQQSYIATTGDYTAAVKHLHQTTDDVLGLLGHPAHGKNH